MTTHARAYALSIGAGAVLAGGLVWGLAVSEHPAAPSHPSGGPGYCDSRGEWRGAGVCQGQPLAPPEAHVVPRPGQPNFVPHPFQSGSSDLPGGPETHGHTPKIGEPVPMPPRASEGPSRGGEIVPKSVWA